MTTNIGSASLTVIPDFDGFDRRIERGAVAGFGRAGKSSGAAFGRSFHTAAKVGIGAALVATAGAIKLGLSAIDEARESQQVGRQTNAVLKSTGRAAKVSARDVGRLAGRLSYMA